MGLCIQRTEDFSRIREIRIEIFSTEMGISKDDIFDNDDQKLEQFLIKNNEEIVGTFRLREEGSSYKLERMGILLQYRSKGLGHLALEEIKTYSKKNNKTKIILDSIYDVSDFYAISGFIQINDMYSKVGIPHVKMYLDL